MALKPGLMGINMKGSGMKMRCKVKEKCATK